MTATDIRHLPTHVELPMLASDDRVRVFEDLEVDALDGCYVCANRTDLPLDAPIPDARMSLTFHYRMGGREQRVDCCGVDCCDVELDDLLNLHHVVGMRLHVPPRSRLLPSGPQGSAEPPPVPVVPEQDQLFLIYDALIRMVRELPNTATVDMSGRDGFLHAQHAVMALFAAQGINRAEQLRRDVA